MADLTAQQALAPHHHQNPEPVALPPSQLPITYTFPLIADTMASPNAFHHQPYDPNYFYHHQHQQQQQESYGFNSKQSINTLFVSGLPDDVKAREIHNLFRRRPGFDFCQLKYTGRGNQVVAFASFLNHQSAMAAMHALNGVLFDPQTGATLHIELARSNSRSMRSRAAGVYFVIDKRAKASPDSQETSSNDGDDGSDEPSGTNNPNSSNKGDLATAESDEVTDTDGAGFAGNSEKPVGGEVQPCSTLFIANLGPNCTESELKQALSQYPGFHIVKMRTNRGMPVAFADFEDVERAAEASQGLQGSLLPSSDRGGLHVEYARSKMRKL